MKCVLCSQRKGKRSCPAKGALICPQCCGEKRILEIDCPESCEYLQAGRDHELSQEAARHHRTSDPIKQRKHERVIYQFHHFVDHVEYFIGKERRASRNLADRDVAGALDLVLDTLRTEDKGIFYDRVSSDLRVDALRRQLQEIVKHHRSTPKKSPGDKLLITEPGREHLRLADVIDSL